MLKRDPELSQAYRDAAHPEPSPALDARILAAARQAVSQPGLPRLRWRPAWFGWAVPLSSAAVLVLGMSLLFRMQQDAPEDLHEARSPLPNKPLERTEMTVPGTATPVIPQAAKTAPAPRQTAPVLPSPAVLSDSAQVEAVMEKMATKRAAEAAEIVASPAPTGAVSMQANRAETAPAAPAFSQSMQRMKAAAPAVEGSVESSAEQAMPSATTKAGVSLPETPEQGVEAIRLLLRQGNIDAARTQLEALRKRYPGFTLPPDLESSRCCPLP